MRYNQYVLKNNVFAEIYAPISSLATTIQVKAGQGARFGNAFPQLLTLENFDDTGKVLKREIVELTGVAGDILTVVRGFAPCPPSDDANSQGQSTFSFNADDKISLYIPKEIFDQISKSIVDLYNNGNDRLFVTGTGGLNISVTGGNARVGTAEIYFAGGTATLTDNATNYVELTGAGVLNISTTGRDTKFDKLAKIVTANGEIISIERRKMDTVGGVMSASAGFKNISNCIYESGLLTSFVADSVTYYLTYEDGRLKTIRFGEALYTVNYSGGRLSSVVES